MWMDWYNYRSILGKCPLPGKCPRTAFQGATIAVSIEMYGILIPIRAPFLKLYMPFVALSIQGLHDREDADSWILLLMLALLGADMSMISCHLSMVLVRSGWYRRKEIVLGLRHHHSPLAAFCCQAVTHYLWDIFYGCMLEQELRRRVPF